MTNDELDAALVRLAHAEREGLRRFLEHLIQFDEQKGPETKAYTSLFVYCRARLLLSESESARRIQAARIAKQCPLVLERLASGEVNLSIVSVLAPHLTPENSRQLLDRAAGKSKRDVEFIVAGLAPRHEPKDIVRFVSPPFNAEPGTFSGLPTAFTPEPPASAAASAPPPEKVEPLTEHSARIHFTATRAVLDKIERARTLLRHKYSKAGYNEIFSDALEALLGRSDPDLKGSVSRRRTPSSSGRRIPQWVKDEVWRRDSGRCSFPSPDGRRWTIHET